MLTASRKFNIARHGELLPHHAVFAEAARRKLLAWLRKPVVLSVAVAWGRPDVVKRVLGDTELRLELPGQLQRGLHQVAPAVRVGVRADVAALLSIHQVGAKPTPQHSPGWC